MTDSSGAPSLPLRSAGNAPRRRRHRSPRRAPHAPRARARRRSPRSKARMSRPSARARIFRSAPSPAHLENVHCVVIADLDGVAGLNSARCAIDDEEVALLRWPWPAGGSDFGVADRRAPVALDDAADELGRRKEPYFRLHRKIGLALSPQDRRLAEAVDHRLHTVRAHPTETRLCLSSLSRIVSGNPPSWPGTPPTQYCSVPTSITCWLLSIGSRLRARYVALTISITASSMPKGRLSSSA